MPWHLDSIDVCSGGLRVVTEAGHGVIVAILDTGIFADHSLFAADSVWAAYQIGRDLKVNRSDPRALATFRLAQEDDHGTAVAGLICAKKVGVAPEARLISIVLPFRQSESPKGYHLRASVFHRALEHLVFEEASFDILNLSIAIPPEAFPETLTKGCRHFLRLLNDRGVVTVAAIGNRDLSKGMIAPGAPACWPEVISVGATDSNQKPWSESLVGKCALTGNALPEVLAPGVRVYTCRAAGDNRGSGTSFSCGIVSGVVALLRSRNRNAPVPSCRKALKSSGAASIGIVKAPQALQAM